MVVERVEAKRSYINVDADFAYDTDLSLEARFLWIILKHHAQNDTGECWPGFSRLSILLGKTEKTVRVAMTELIAKGFVTRQRRGQGKTNLYTVNDLRTVDFPVQETQNGNVVPFRTASPPVLEQSKTTDEVITSEIITSEVVATTKDSPTVLQDVCSALGITKDMRAEELVEISMGNRPGTNHVERALRCVAWYDGEWSKKSEIKRAGHYSTFCKNESNPLPPPNYTVKSASSNAGPSPTAYVRYETPIVTDVPQAAAMFQAIKGTGTCPMKTWETLQQLTPVVRPDGTLVLLAPDEQTKSEIERLHGHRIDMACRESHLQFEIGVGA